MSRPDRRNASYDMRKELERLGFKPEVPAAQGGKRKGPKVDKGALSDSSRAILARLLEGKPREDKDFNLRIARSVTELDPLLPYIKKLNGVSLIFN